MRNIIIIIISLLPGIAHAQVKSDPVRDKAITLKRFLEQHHYRPLQWNDSASMLLYDKWMNELDEEKMLFTQKDIDILQTYRTGLDEEMNGKGWTFFDLSSKIYRARLHIGDSLTREYLSKPMDLSKPDTVTHPYKNYAANEAELAKRYHSYLKYDLLYNLYDKLSADNDSVSPLLPADFAKQESEIRSRLLKRHISNMQILQSPQKFNDGMADHYLDAIAWCYDPHTNYMNLKKRDEFEAEVSASEYSAGFSMEENKKGEKIIGFLEPGGSAWRSGQLHKGDVLVKIKSGSTEKDAADLSTAELNAFLNTEGIEDVVVTVRTAAAETKIVKLQTEKVADEEQVVKSYLIKGATNIGYINLPGFYSREEEGEKEANFNGCANDMSKEIVKLEKDNISGLILDLRDNGGGSMWEAMQLAGIFIDAGPVASVKEKDGKVTFMKDPNRGTIYDGPMIILVNGHSASASEFFSATLQDYNRALIVGGTTYGKGTAQVVEPMDTLKADPSKKYEEFVKVTEEKFYRVNGSTVQWTGVVPDILLPDLYSDISYKEKGEKSALQPDISKRGYFEPLPALPVSALRAKSEARVKDDPYFKTIAGVANELKELEKGVNIPLQWPGFVKFNRTEEAVFAEAKEQKKNKEVVLSAANNGFDAELLRAADEKAKEKNTAYLKNIEDDEELAEAARILADWSGIK